MPIRVFLTLSTILLGVHANAQSNAPFLQDGLRWIEYRTFVPGDDYIEFLTCGDTLLAGQTYRKVYWMAFLPAGFVGGLRQEGDQVYWQAADPSEPEILLYDFSLEPGEALPYVSLDGIPDTVTVDSVTTETLLGQTRKIWHFNQYDLRWIEGVGSNQGLFWRPEDATSASTWTLSAVFLHDELYYCNLVWPYRCSDEVEVFCEMTSGTQMEGKAKVSITVYPNPAGDLLEVEYQGATAGTLVFSLYNLMGKPLRRRKAASDHLIRFDLTGLAAGVYILDIRQKETGRKLGGEKVIKQ